MPEYARPWKLASFAAGVALLIAGSFYYRAPDWDIPISLIMASLAYLTAPWSLREANFAASLSLYAICGLLWLYRGSLRELLGDAYAMSRSVADGSAWRSKRRL